jgi:tetratricopeptide (TPR) repeat protein
VAAAWVARSYALQARFDLQGALAAAQEAVRVEPNRALAWARLAELWLSVGYPRRARGAAARAVQLNPQLARTQTVLGFALLADGKVADARSHFDRAIALDQADPLPRVGLGLALIRGGALEEGRQALEVAASLDPGDSLVRSYLGKAYHDERREEPAEETLAAAKQLDPTDPTPYYYDALRKQQLNRPVEALRDLERAIDLNDQSAVYRSRLLLDEDLAARTASLGRLYQDLGFGQLGLVEGWRSTAADPGNFSAHRFLAETYAVLPRHDIATSSELLQSELLQPLNVNPIPPRLGGVNLRIPVGLAPGSSTFSEFNPLFERDRVALLLSGVLGTNGTVGDEATLFGLWNNAAGNAGQFHYESNGFRPNNDQTVNLYSLFAQYRLTSSTSVQAELRQQKTENGDLDQRFFPDNFSRDLRERDRLSSARLGLRQSFGPGADFLASFIYHTADAEVDVQDVFNIRTREEGLTFEVQEILRFRWADLVAGGGFIGMNRRDDVATFLAEDTTRARIDHGNVYGYVPVRPLPRLTVTLGLSADFFEGGVRDRDQVNPKLGLTWTPPTGTTVRAAVFRTLRRTLATNQTLEPTQVAGFAQFFDDVEATDAWRYGVGIDQKFTPTLFVGGEVSGRSLDVPFTDVTGLEPEVHTTDWREGLARAYLYWAAFTWLAMTTEYEFEVLDRENPLDEGIRRSRTHRVPVSLRLFHPTGLWGRVTGTLVDQHGTFVDEVGEFTDGSSRFIVVDLALGYRLPGRYGILSLEARNVFDQQFRFQDTDPSNPRILPGRLVLGKLTLAF